DIDLLAVEQCLAAAEQAGPRPAAAPVDLMALHRQDDFGAAGIAGHDPQRQTKQLAQHVGKYIAFRPAARGADDVSFAAHVIPGPDPGGFDEGADAHLARYASEPGETRRVELSALTAPEQGLEYSTRRERADHGAVPGRDVKEIIDRLETARTRHVLWDDARIARNIA